MQFVILSLVCALSAHFTSHRAILLTPLSIHDRADTSTVWSPTLTLIQIHDRDQEPRPVCVLICGAMTGCMKGFFYE